MLWRVYTPKRVDMRHDVAGTNELGAIVERQQWKF